MPFDSSIENPVKCFTGLNTNNILVTPGETIGAVSVSSSSSVSAPTTLLSSVSNDTEDTAFDELLAKREEILRQSSLANELRSVYHALLGGLCVNVTINGNVSIDIKLTKSSSGKDEPDGHEIGGLFTHDLPSPFQTLLTVAEPDDMRDFLIVSRNMHSQHNGTHDILYTFTCCAML